jgi:hypothetical protein
MRAKPLDGLRVLIVVAGVMAGACGRLGYDPLAVADAGGGRGGNGGTSGLGGGSAGTGVGGATGGGSGATGGATGGSIGGRGGASGAGGGPAGTGGGGAAGADGGAAISCYTAAYGGHQYAFCDALVAWDTARAECEARGMRLVRIDDILENNWLQANAMFSASMFRRENLWLGGFEPTTDGDWHWTDGDAFWSGAANGMAVGGLFTNWNKSEPNNSTGPEACLSMQLNGTTWFDYGCSNPQYFACELY